MRRDARMDISDRVLWQRSRAIDADLDDAARYLDLAALVDGIPDPDEQERVAAWVAADPHLAEDVVAVRTLAAAADADIEPPPEAVVARACALVPDASTPTGTVVPFRRSAQERPVLRSAAEWGSLAAALVVAGWLGFTLGMDAWGALAPSRQMPDDTILQELLGPPPDLIGDA